MRAPRSLETGPSHSQCAFLVTGTVMIVAGGGAESDRHGDDGDRMVLTMRMGTVSIMAVAQYMVTNRALTGAGRRSEHGALLMIL